MSDKQDTVLNSITDNLAESFFDGGASSKNVITPEEKKPEEGKKEEKKDDKPLNGNIGFLAETKMAASDLLGDLLEKSTTAVTDHVTKETVEPEKKVESSDDFNFLVESKILAGFEDDSPIKTKEDLEKLIKGNKEQWIAEAKQEALKDELGSLPEEVKFILDYAKSGGNDLKSVFKLLGQNQEFKEFDTANVEDQKALIRTYYSTQNWTDDEIEEELINLVENKRLQTQAEKIKPKLETINQAQLERKQQQQKLVEQQQQEARQFFTQNVVETLKKGKLGELVLSKEEQADIYNALVREKYESYGGVTNRLGALLDKIQYVEPNYELLSEVTFLLSNPVEYKKRIRNAENTNVTADQVKKIKIEQNKQKINSEHNPEKENKKMPKLSSSFINPFA